MTGSSQTRPCPMQVNLAVVDGPHRGRSFTCIGHENFLVGRSNRAHFRLPRADQFFSRLHFMIETNPPCCRLFDMNSTNGTLVNGHRIMSVDLKDGDLIQGGETVIRISMLGDWTQARQIAASRPVGAATGENVHHDGEDTITYAPVTGLPTSATECLPPDKLIHQPLPAIPGYRILKELGRGGMGVVYLAMSESDQRPVAIKMIRPAVAVSAHEVERFLCEVNILQQLRHPNIVDFYSSGEAAGRLYFVMEYVSGANAASIVKNHGPMSVDRAVRVSRQMLEALQHAHEQGFVHRDVKPANLLIGDRDLCKLADFGLARAYYSSSMSGLTMMDQVVGTLPFMPPEQITDYRKAIPQTDQYAAAATLYYLLTSSYVFDFDDPKPSNRLTKILMEEPVPIQSRRAELPLRLARVVHRALSREVTDRFESCNELRNALLPFE
jgi:eukaryotic-like serine/threonine-protein kinase